MSPGRSAARPTLTATRTATEGPSPQIRSSHRWGSPSRTGSWARASPANPSIKRTISGSPPGGSGPVPGPVPEVLPRRARRAATSESRWRSSLTRRSRSAGETTAPTWGSPLSTASLPPSRSMPYRWSWSGGRMRARSSPAVTRVVVVPDPGPPTTTKWPQSGCHPSVNRCWRSGSSTSQAAGRPGPTAATSSSTSTASRSGGGHGDRGLAPPRRQWAAFTALTTRTMSGSSPGSVSSGPAGASDSASSGPTTAPFGSGGSGAAAGLSGSEARAPSGPRGSVGAVTVISSMTRTRRPRVAGGVTPVTRADWNATSSPGPNRARARPGRYRGMAAASAAPITSLESWRSVTRRAIRQLVLALMSSVTAPAGRWVASTR